MKKLRKGAINWIRKNDIRIKEYAERAEKALFVNRDIAEMLFCITKVQKLKDINRMLRHEPQYHLSYTDIQDMWNKLNLSHGTKEEYLIYHTQNFDILINL